MSRLAPSLLAIVLAACGKEPPARRDHPEARPRDPAVTRERARAPVDASVDAPDREGMIIDGVEVHPDQVELDRSDPSAVPPHLADPSSPFAQPRRGDDP